MNKSQALQFLAQVAQDFLNTLPLSAREAFRDAAQKAITELQKPEEPPASGNGQQP